MATMTEQQEVLLWEAKSLLQRSRMGAKAVVALGLATVHVRLAPPDQAKGTLVLSDQEPAILIAIRLAAIGLKLRSPDEADDAIRRQALEVAEDLAKRLGGEEAQLLRERVLGGSFELAVPRSAAPKAKKKLKVLPKPLSTRLAKQGFVYLGTFEVGEGDIVVQENTEVSVPARAGAWFAFATRQGKTDDLVGALLACYSEEVEGLEELVRDAKPAGEIFVEGGTAAIVDSEWSDYGPLDKWTEPVEDPIAADWGCRIGERGCQTSTGGDGAYPVSAYLGRDGRARLVRVSF